MKGTLSAALVLLLGLAAAGCGGSTTTVTVTRTHTVTTTRTVTKPAAAPAPPCTGGELSGVFAAVPGSAGAGQIEYVLTLTNTSTGRCWVSGLPQVGLLGAGGASLPTHVAAAQPGVPTAVRVVLEPGGAATASARFSPTVAGPGDSQSGACQPKARALQVIPNGGGSTDAPAQPPTSVCEQGTLNFGVYRAAS